MFFQRCRPSRGVFSKWHVPKFLSTPWYGSWRTIHMRDCWNWLALAMSDRGQDERPEWNASRVVGAKIIPVWSRVCWPGFDTTPGFQVRDIGGTCAWHCDQFMLKTRSGRADMKRKEANQSGTARQTWESSLRQQLNQISDVIGDPEVFFLLFPQTGKSLLLRRHGNFPILLMLAKNLQLRRQLWGFKYNKNGLTINREKQYWWHWKIDGETRAS